jgi:hypothetical protein
MNTRPAWPPGTLQQLLARAADACKCGAPLEPLDGFVCARCRRAADTTTPAPMEGEP